MDRQNDANVNEPEHMDAVWADPARVHEMRPSPRLEALLGLVIPYGALTLDVGCGNGSYWPLFEQSRLHGIEFAPGIAARTAAKFPKAQVVVHDFRSGLPYKDGAFDAVFCGEVVEHLERPERLLSEIRRVLVLGGRLVLTTPFQDRIKCPEHLWSFSVDDVYRMLDGFRNVAVFRYGFSDPNDWDHMAALATK